MEKTRCQFEFMWITSVACVDNSHAEDVSNDCKVINPQTNVQFDLTPLRDKLKDYEVRDKKNRTYHLNVCGPLVQPPNCKETHKLRVVSNLGEKLESGRSIRARTKLGGHVTRGKHRKFCVPSSRQVYPESRVCACISPALLFSPKLETTRRLVQ